MSGPPAPPSDASTVDAMIAHQVVLRVMILALNDQLGTIVQDVKT